ncbi:tRNA (adenosine(37)-N6)-threonylcarbamoyltransferase complex dimerization subunit type 1 TsaB [Chloroflexota bacterium]
MQLAIDTSTGMASLALVDGSRYIAELTWNCGQNHSIELIPRLTYLLNQVGVDINTTTGIIVALGPGSFNGLRVGVSTAKGLAFSLVVPIVGISTLAVEAYPHAETGLPVCAVANAGREEIATATYQQKRNHWQPLVAEHITTVDTLCTQIADKTVFCGEFIASIATKLKKQLKQKALIPPPATRLRRAGFLAELGLKRLEAADYDNPATLQPLYLRRPLITKAKHR